MKAAELDSLTVMSLAVKIREGKVSPREVVEALLERIEKTEPAIKAYLTVCKEDALALAEIAEKQIQAGYDFGPLHGVPVTVKDLFETKGIRTTCGSKILKDYVPTEDATVVKLLKRAGAIILGKSNTHEFALGSVTPPTKNPWNIQRIPGGSSGGSAAATAASSALISLGSDTGGSIRIPASFCGVVGLKPTYGRVSRVGVFPESWSLDHVGPIAKTVADAGLLMNIISGHDERDPTSANKPVPDFTKSLTSDIVGIKIGVPENHFFDRIDHDVMKAVKDAIKILENLGAEIVPIRFPLISEIMAAHTAIDTSECATFHERWIRQRPQDYTPDARAYIEQGFFVLATQYVRAQRFRGFVLPQVLKVLEQADVLATPSQPITAPPIGTERVTIDGVEEDLNWTTGRFAAPFNLTGMPAISVPCGFSRDKLPIGLQIAGRPFDESTILQTAHAYEQRTEWHKMHPEL